MFGAFLMHPAYLGTSLLWALIYSVLLRGRRAVRFQVSFLLPLMLAAALINPAFNHEGGTILAYLPGGNPLTLESILYGVAAAAMLAAVICWFSCYNEVMTSDKFIYLFGRILPSLSLLLSMSLRFVPRFKAQLAVIVAAQRGIGRDMSAGGVRSRARRGITVLSAMVTWALENAVETADSMKSRGYGLPGRTAFSVFVWSRRDIWALLYLVVLIVYILIACCGGGITFRYFPHLQSPPTDWYRGSVFAAYCLLCSMPVMIELREGIRWKS